MFVLSKPSKANSSNPPRRGGGCFGNTSWALRARRESKDALPAGLPASLCRPSCASILGTGSVCCSPCFLKNNLKAFELLCPQQPQQKEHKLLPGHSQLPAGWGCPGVHWSSLRSLTGTGTARQCPGAACSEPVCLLAPWQLGLPGSLAACLKALNVCQVLRSSPEFLLSGSSGRTAHSLDCPEITFQGVCFL